MLLKIPIGIYLPFNLLHEEEKSRFNLTGISLNADSLKVLLYSSILNEVKASSSSSSSSTASSSSSSLAIEWAWDESKSGQWPILINRTSTTGAATSGPINVINELDPSDSSLTLSLPLHRWLDLGLRDLMDHRLFVLCYQEFVASALAKACPFPYNYWSPGRWKKQALSRMSEFKDPDDGGKERLSFSLGASEGDLMASSEGSRKDSSTSASSWAAKAFNVSEDVIKFVGQRELIRVKPFLSEMERLIRQKEGDLTLQVDPNMHYRTKIIW
jgi:hypothetical protein